MSFTIINVSKIKYILSPCHKKYFLDCNAFQYTRAIYNYSLIINQTLLISGFLYLQVRFLLKHGVSTIKSIYTEYFQKANILKKLTNNMYICFYGNSLFTM